MAAEMKQRKPEATPLPSYDQELLRIVTLVLRGYIVSVTVSLSTLRYAHREAAAGLTQLTAHR